MDFSLKNILDSAENAMDAAADKLGDLKDAALEKAGEIANSETVTNLKEKAGEYYDKAQTAAADVSSELQEGAGDAVEAGKGFWEKAKAFAEEKTEAVKDSLMGDDDEKDPKSGHLLVARVLRGLTQKG